MSFLIKKTNSEENPKARKVKLDSSLKLCYIVQCTTLYFSLEIYSRIRDLILALMSGHRYIIVLCMRFYFLLFLSHLHFPVKVINLICQDRLTKQKRVLINKFYL